MPIDKPTPNVSETVVEVPKQEELIQERDEIIEKKDQTRQHRSYNGRRGWCRNCI